MGYKGSLSKRTGSMGPKGEALWPKLNSTTGEIYSMGAAPLIYNTTTGIYNTAYDANAAVSSASFKNFKFGKKSKRRSKRRSKRKSKRKSRKARKSRKSRKTRKSRSFGKYTMTKRRSVKTKWKNPSRDSRKRMMKKCGTKCFLKPETLGFPICKPNCKVSKYGLEAAYKRARQWGYDDVAKKAKSMMKSKRSR